MSDNDISVMQWQLDHWSATNRSIQAYASATERYVKDEDNRDFALTMLDKVRVYCIELQQSLASAGASPSMMVPAPAAIPEDYESAAIMDLLEKLAAARLVATEVDEELGWTGAGVTEDIDRILALIRR